ncbi:MAG TPA: hypothetical protein VLK33_12120 [Terriglobales bacterium]|nr:hypothetical protein [Terriglobales bacterium]
MRTLGILFAVLLPALLGPSNVVGENSKHTAVVRVTIIDSPGGRLEGGKVAHFKNRATGQDLASRFHLDRFLDQAAAGIPFGKYDVIITQPGFPASERPVEVFKQEIALQVCVRTATVHLVDLGPLNTSSSIETLVSSFRNRVDEYELASRFKNGVADNVPYGTYDIRVSKRYATPLERRVDVFQPDVWIVTSLQLSPISLPEYRAPANVVAGRLENIDPADATLYVSLVGIHSNFRIDDRVSVTGTSGTFSLAGFNPSGDFLLLTYGSKGILDIRCVQLPTKTSIVVDLGTHTIENGCHA